MTANHVRSTVIRPGTRADAEAVARVHLRTRQHAYAELLPAERLAAESLQQRIEQWARWPPLVAEENDQIVGFVSVGSSRDKLTDGELYAIYVDPDHWRSGIGRDLIRAGEERLRELGHTDAVLWVFEDNLRARRFYEHAGWQLDAARRTTKTFGVSVQEVRYRKQL
jgi:ribosomal protein S18 acetylase RimI-like enzyme